MPLRVDDGDIDRRSHQVERWCGNTAKRIQPEESLNNVEAMLA